MRIFGRASVVAAGLLLMGLVGCGQEQQATQTADSTAEAYDLLLLGGTVVDGSGEPRYRADVAVADGRIVKIGDLDEGSAGKTLDISGKVLAPGFIDTHSHADAALDDPQTASVEGFLRQGVTTAVYGVDGSMGLARLKDLAAREGSMGVNFMSYIGHNAVRRDVMGMENRPPTGDDMGQMQAQVKEAMELGAAGLSTGLMYLPGSYANTEEVVELARVTAPYGAVYDSHIRDPANNLLASHQECLDIAAAAGVDAHPGHVKAVGGANFGKGPDFVTLIEAGLAKGQNITVDLYPYDGAATTPIITLLYPGDDERGRALMKRLYGAMNGEIAEGDSFHQMEVDFRQYWRDMDGNAEILAQARAKTEQPPEGVFSWVNVVGYQSMRIVVSDQEGFEGKMVLDLAAELGLDPFELYRQIIVTEGSKAMVTLGAIQEPDIQVIMKRPWAMISSDGAEVNPDHPRGRGTFPRVLGRYVREWGVLTLEEGVHKISGLPAKYLKQKDRGVIREGAIADLVVFDPETVIDRATWAEPTLYSEGIEHVFIGGEAALENGELTENRLGRFVPFTGD